MREINVMSMIICPSRIDKWLKEIGIECVVELLQNACLLGTARVTRKVIST